LPDDEAQSFVVRVWSEGPGLWRGKISHLPRGAHEGFTRLSQAVRFMEQRIPGYRREPAAEYEPRAAGKRGFQANWLTGRKLRLASALACLALLAGGALLVSMPSGGGSLAGAAAGGGLDMGPGLVFLAGATAGGTATALWVRAR